MTTACGRRPSYMSHEPLKCGKKRIQGAGSGGLRMSRGHSHSGAKRPGRPAGKRGRTMGKVIGIDLGTTNSCVAVMEGKTPESHRERRRHAHHALDRRLHRRRRAPGRPAGQAPGGHQSGKDHLRGQAPDRPPLRRPDGREGQEARPLQDRQGRRTATPGSRSTARPIRPRRSPPSSCRR